MNHIHFLVEATWKLKKQMIQKIKKFGDAGQHTQLLKAIVNTL